MTGAEHYREAERLLDGPAPYSRGEEEAWQQDRADNLAAAQVHATLALAAATAYPAIRDYYGDEASDPRDWAGATS